MLKAAIPPTGMRKASAINELKNAKKRPPSGDRKDAVADSQKRQDPGSDFAKSIVLVSTSTTIRRQEHGQCCL
jgi:hypothetical protein